ncbi:hypothetical protein FNO01nite_17570 [Flavobacterium noncentrifugens]|uniref:Response regulatory domain-containing protein n=1 Tax=Flavobacterium noncentrifugens TaxID=1128970 RepID=A0A1G8WXT1_9FLAO|nr:hypothetical protein [Flavobacterium noncentrifugens]GEP51085.1 hypothetical protein FNO01nite_17570 [Flavobacterium noncentrifugens]SDJ82876.1 hypothetical protein SAMN04487935_1983 [Flavobacterium noncentrifugens]
MIPTALKLKAILIEDHRVNDDTFQKALENIGKRNSVKVFKDVLQCLKHLKEDTTSDHQVLFMDFSEAGNKCLDAIKLLRNHKKYSDLSIAVYDADATMTNEETFVAGGNIYIQKANNISELGKVLQKVVKADYQYTSGKLNRQTYFLSV